MGKYKGLMLFKKFNSILYMFGVVAVIFIAAALFVSEDVSAKVVGRCDNCHTMHNSQDGADMVIPVGAEDPPAGTGTCGGCHLTPRENLLTRSCIGCHVLDLNGGGIGDLGDGQPVPQVAYALNASDSVASGNFQHVFAADQNGHNVHGFGLSIGSDFNQSGFPVMPPGYKKSFDYSAYGYDTIADEPGGETAPNSYQIVCAGVYGCHGNRDIIRQSNATAGSHHADDSMLKFGGIDTGSQGLTSGSSYRFLSGVWGGEDSDWESTVSVSDHNEYYGQVLADRESQAAGDVNTMSEFCAGCHGNFHASSSALRTLGEGLGTQSPWIRHPTDVALPAYAPYSDYTSYKLSAPVARTSIPDPSQEAVAGGTGIVFCLSCHRAHGSSEYDILRFSYVKMLTGAGGSASGTGCFACHGDKD